MSEYPIQQVWLSKIENPQSPWRAVLSVDDADFFNRMLQSEFPEGVAVMHFFPEFQYLGHQGKPMTIGLA